MQIKNLQSPLSLILKSVLTVNLKPPNSSKLSLTPSDLLAADPKI